MTDLFTILFCANVSLEQLSNIFGYDESTIINMLKGSIEMTNEEKTTLEEVIGKKITL